MNTSRGIRERETGTCAGELVLMPRNGWLRQGNEWLPWVCWGQLVHVPRGGDQCLHRKELVLAREKLWRLHREGEHKGSHSWMCMGVVMPEASIGGRQDTKGAYSRALRRPGVMLKGAETPEG